MAGAPALKITHPSPTPVPVRPPAPVLRPHFPQWGRPAEALARLEAGGVARSGGIRWLGMAARWAGPVAFVAPFVEFAWQARQESQAYEEMESERWLTTVFASPMIQQLPPIDWVVSPALPPLVWQPKRIASREVSSDVTRASAEAVPVEPAVTEEPPSSSAPSKKQRGRVAKKDLPILFGVVFRVAQGLTPQERKTITPIDFWRRVRTEAPAPLNGESVLALEYGLSGFTREPAIARWLVGSRALLLEALQRADRKNPKAFAKDLYRQMMAELGWSVRDKTDNFFASIKTWMGRDVTNPEMVGEIETIVARHQHHGKKETATWKSFIAAARVVAKELQAKEGATREDFRAEVAELLGYQILPHEKLIRWRLEGESTGEWDALLSRFPRSLGRAGNHDQLRITVEKYQKTVEAFKEADRWGDAEEIEGYVLRVDRVADILSNGRLKQSGGLSFILKQINYSGFDRKPIVAILQKWGVPERLYRVIE